MCVSRFVGSAQGVARGRGLVYTGSSGSPSLKASVSLGRTGLCTSDPGPHADAALISLPPDMDSEDARAPWDPCGAAAPIPHTRGEGQPLHCPPLQDGRPVTHPPPPAPPGAQRPRPRPEPGPARHQRCSRGPAQHHFGARGGSRASASPGGARSCPRLERGPGRPLSTGSLGRCPPVTS